MYYLICVGDSNTFLLRPMIYKNLANFPKMRAKLRISGHKCFSRLNASGNETHETLKNTKMSNTIKYIRKFEFDP